MLTFYAQGKEARRLFSGAGRLERARTQELLDRYLPPPPAVILDVGGGAGVYACWLAKKGYEVHLVDAVPLHVEQARRASAQQPEHPLASVAVGDARALNRPAASADVVLLLGPLYHLTQRDDRLSALREATRVLRDGGLVCAVGISRFASALDGLAQGFMDDPAFVRIVKQDLSDGQHCNPTDHPGYFTTTFFHRPDELETEVVEAGLRREATLAVEGPGWLLHDLNAHWRDRGRRERLLDTIRWLEAEPSLLGASAHVMVIARKVG
jgi:ubiquinone/menaquinone biosynthesis C-methylase UbiE